MEKKVIAVIAVIMIVLLAAVFLFRKSPKDVEVQADPSAFNVQEIFESAQALEKKNNLLKAKDLYQRIIVEHPDYRDISTVQENLEDINMRIIYSGLETPQTVIHEVEKGDSLGKIAQKYNTTIELIKKTNNLKSNIIRIGQRLRIWQGTFNVFVDKSQNILMLKSGDEVIKVYTVSTGKDNCTPVGTFKIVNKLVNPVWFKSGAIIPPESPKNILGTRWLGFDIPGYGIHGTTEPESLGQQATAGCVRMRNEEVEELYDLLSVGAEVVVVD